MASNSNKSKRNENVDLLNGPVSIARQLASEFNDNMFERMGVEQPADPMRQLYRENGIRLGRLRQAGRQQQAQGQARRF